MATNTSDKFNPSVESIEEFIQRFKLQNYEKLNSANNDNKKKAMLLANSLPVQVLTDLQRRLKPTLLTEATYDVIEQNLISSFSVKKSLVGSAVTFFNRKQQASESIEAYSKILNELGSKCEYKSCCLDCILRDIFVSGLNNSKIISSLITECENLKFHEVVEKRCTR
mgnify:CR=1 FL=1